MNLSQLFPLPAHDTQQLQVHHMTQLQSVCSKQQQHWAVMSHDWFHLPLKMKLIDDAAEFWILAAQNQNATDSSRCPGMITCRQGMRHVTCPVTNPLIEHKLSDMNTYPHLTPLRSQPTYLELIQSCSVSTINAYTYIHTCIHAGINCNNNLWVPYTTNCWNWSADTVCSWFSK
mgnify:CR=1 FL=1